MGQSASTPPASSGASSGGAWNFGAGGQTFSQGIGQVAKNMSRGAGAGGGGGNSVYSPVLQTPIYLGGGKFYAPGQPQQGGGMT